MITDKKKQRVGCPCPGGPGILTGAKTNLLLSRLPDNSWQTSLAILIALTLAPVTLADPTILLDKSVKPEIHHARADVARGSLETLPDGTWHISPPPADAPSNPARLVLPVLSAVKAGERLVFECELRAADASGADRGQAGLVLDLLSSAFEAENPQKSSFFRHVLLAGADWETFRVPVEIDAALAENAWCVLLSPSYFRQDIELRGLRLRRLAEGEAATPAISYPGQDTDAAWRKEAAERIARYRMSGFELQVTDPRGNPLPGAKVTLRQKRHAYLFGTCVSAARLTDAEFSFRDPLMTREQFLADNLRYREELRRLFNFVVFENELKWPMWSGNHSNFSQRATLDACRWLEQNKFSIKGHTLLWASWQQTPAWLRELQNDPATLQAAIIRHIRDAGTATAAHAAYWDVLNEPMSHRDIIELLGHGAVAEWFKTAREVLPGCKLVMNEFDIVGNGGSAKRRAGLLALLRDLQQADGAPDLLGFQSHFWSDRLTPPETIWSICDEMHNASGLPLMVSEFDMNFPNDVVQADYTRDFLTAWFAHPATEAFIMWGFWAGAHWFGERGAMFRKDWSPKPNLKTYTDLVFRDWWTIADGETKADGTWQTRAFHGDYELTVDAHGHHSAFRLPTIEKAGAALEVILHPVKSGN